MFQVTKLQKPTKKCSTLRFIVFSFNCNLSYFGFKKVVHIAIAKAICTFGVWSSVNTSSMILVKKSFFFYRLEQFLITFCHLWVFLPSHYLRREIGSFDFW